MFVYLDTSKMQCTFYRLDFHNLHTRKNSEMVQTVQRELSINSNTTRSQIQINAYNTGHLRDMFYVSKSQLIQFPDWQSDWKSILNNLQIR